MSKLADIGIAIISHPYVLVLLGAGIYEAQRSIAKKSTLKTFMRETSRSTILSALVVIFDDEVLALFERQTGVDFSLDWKFYILAGFLLDWIRKKHFNEPDRKHISEERGGDN